MKKKTTEVQTDDVLPEYDLKSKKDVRGKYTKALQTGYSIRILNEDGTITEHDESDALIEQARKQATETGLKQNDIRSAIAKARKRK